MTLSAEKFIEHAVYDAKKRHERYMKTRRLKGRQHGQNQDTGPGRPGEKAGPAPVNKTVANQQASNARQIADLKARLSELRAKLQSLLAEVTSSSSSSSSSSKSGEGSSSKGKPMTAQEKADARKASQKYRDTHPSKDKKSSSKSTPTKEEQIAHIRAIIADVESKLRAALEKARTQTASNGR